jgi:hypothetical protein
VQRVQCVVEGALGVVGLIAQHLHERLDIIRAIEVDHPLVRQPLQRAEHADLGIHVGRRDLVLLVQPRLTMSSPT